jgi:cytochrome c biogenesis protein CcmG/thiol:disulfide interchange protein DsbE
MDTTEPAPDDDYGEFEARRRKPLRLIALVLVLALPAYFLLRPAPPQPSDTIPPEFELPLLDGTGTITSAELKGSPVVINYFASWCVPCREEAPLLEATWNEYRDQGLVVLGIAVMDSPDRTKEFVEEFGLTFPVVTDLDQTVAKQMGLIGLPQTFFVEPAWTYLDGTAPGAGGPSGQETGNDRGVTILGAISAEELRARVEQLLGLGQA